MGPTCRLGAGAQPSAHSSAPPHVGHLDHPSCQQRAGRRPAAQDTVAHGRHAAPQRRGQAAVARAAAAEGAAATPVGVGEIADVADVTGIRVLPGDDGRPLIEYLVQWKDGAAPTWEPVENLADNLLRDFEEKWWKACREGDEAGVRALLETSAGVLPHCVDSNNRSALHFAAALGKAECCRQLCEAGADVDFPDKDGYTPLHMAVGYSHVSTVKTLLDHGANPEVPDTQGRNVVQLVDSIRDQMPLNPQLAAKRIALEEVSGLLTGNLFEEVLPKRILEEREAAAGGSEFLVQWADGADDSWVRSADVAADVVADFRDGFEYAEARELLKMKWRGDQQLFLVRWLDGSPDSWENEDNLSPRLIEAFQQARQGGGLQAALLPALPAAAAPKKRKARRRRKRSPDTTAAEAPDGGRSGSGSPAGAELRQEEPVAA